MSNDQRYYIVANDCKHRLSATPSGAFAMAIRLPKNITTLLQQNPNADMAISIGSNPTMVVDGKSYSVKAFAEKQECYEVFKSIREDGVDWMVQQGSIHKKLQVQRELSNVAEQLHHQTKMETKKEKTRTVLKKNSDFDRLSSTTRRNNRFDPTTLSRSMIDKQQRSEKEKIRKGIENLKKSTPSPSVLNRLSPRPMSPKSPSPSISPARKTATSPVRKSTKSKSKKPKYPINSKLSVEQQLIHVLAIQPMSMASVISRLGIKDRTNKEFKSCLKKVAEFKDPGRYFLKDDFVDEISIDSWPYSNEEKDRVTEFLAKTKDEPVYLSPTMSPVKKKKKRKRSRESQEANVGKEKKSKGISSAKEYSDNRQKFDEKYPVYLELDKKISDNIKLYEKLGAELEANRGTEKEKSIVEKIRNHYEGSKDEIKETVQRFHELHEELGRLRGLVDEYLSGL